MGASTSSEATGSLRSQIEGKISGADVMIFSKTYCPYCTKAKDAIKALGAKHDILELDVAAEGSAIQAELQNMTGQRTVPNIFVKGKHLGGCDDTLAAIKSGKFQQMLENK